MDIFFFLVTDPGPAKYWIMRAGAFDVLAFNEKETDDQQVCRNYSFDALSAYLRE